MIADRFLPGVPGEQIEEILNKAPGNEIVTGKFDSLESSAALAVNTFGFFLNRPVDLPLLPGCPPDSWPAQRVEVEKTLRFPWRGGRHPVLDCLVTTAPEIIGIESKRYEPFRKKSAVSLSGAYWRQCWGERMKGYEAVRDKLNKDKRLYVHLDAAQLFKHAFALRTQVYRKGEYQGLNPILFYVYAEPELWPRDGVPVDEEAKIRHREELADFAATVADDEVRFVSCSYKELLADWGESDKLEIRAHAEAVIKHFSP